MKRHCFTLDLKNDPALIEEYEKWHGQVWPEILDSIKRSGVESLEIYRYVIRLFMIMETNESFSFERKAAMDLANPKVRDWETLMLRFQQPLPGISEEDKWVLLKKIFQL